MPRLPIPKGSSTDRVLKAGLLIALVVVLVALPHTAEPYRVFQFTIVGVFAIATMGVNLLTGYNGQISLGHSFFFAVGAYTSGALVTDHGWNYLVALIPAFVLTFVLGFLFGIPALRLEGLYLALVTLALGVVAPPLIRRFDGITGGSHGLSVDEPAAPAWTGLADDQWRYYVVLAVAVVVFTVSWNLTRGRVGRALTAIRDNHIAAEAMGVDLAVFKTLTFAFSTAFAGVAGALFPYMSGGFVGPESFNVLLAIEFLTGAVVGGLATIFGPLIGALFTYFLPEFASDLNPAAPNVIYGLVLIFVVVLAPSGVVGLIAKLRDLVIDRSPRTADAGVSDFTPDAPPAADPLSVPSAPLTSTTREIPE